MSKLSSLLMGMHHVKMADLSTEIKLLDKEKDKKSIALRKRLRAKLPQLKQYVLYLETNPTKEYCEKEVARISNRINEISKQYIPPQNPERFTKGQLTAMNVLQIGDVKALQDVEY